MASDDKNVIICDRHGGSRLWIAQKYDLDIPCMVSDFCNMFPEYKSLKEEELLDYYKDKPDCVIMNPSGIDVSVVPQIHLYKEYD